MKGGAGGKDPRRGLGARGETIAAGYLRHQGYTILDRNWRCPRGELDLIAKEGETLAFVEVRTRRGLRSGPTPEESITPAKQRKLIELAQLYLQAQGLEDVDWRIDVVAVEMDGQGRLQRVELIRDAVTGW